MSISIFTNHAKKLLYIFIWIPLSLHNSNLDYATEP